MAIAKKMKLKQGTWLQLSEVVGPGWGDAEDEDVPVVDHAARRRKRAAKARQGAGRAAAALLAGRGSASEPARAGFFGDPADSAAFCRFAAGGTGGAPCASAARA